MSGRSHQNVYTAPFKKPNPPPPGAKAARSGGELPPAGLRVPRDRELIPATEEAIPGSVRSRTPNRSRSQTPNERSKSQAKSYPEPEDRTRSPFDRPFQQGPGRKPSNTFGTPRNPEVVAQATWRPVLTPEANKQGPITKEGGNVESSKEMSQVAADRSRSPTNRIDRTPQNRSKSPLAPPKSPNERGSRENNSSKNRSASQPDGSSKQKKFDTFGSPRDPDIVAHGTWQPVSIAGEENNREFDSKETISGMRHSSINGSKAQTKDSSGKIPQDTFGSPRNPQVVAQGTGRPNLTTEKPTEEVLTENDEKNIDAHNQKLQTSVDRSRSPTKYNNQKPHAGSKSRMPSTKPATDQLDISLRQPDSKKKLSNTFGAPRDPGVVAHGTWQPVSIAGEPTKQKLSENEIRTTTKNSIRPQDRNQQRSQDAKQTQIVSKSAVPGVKSSPGTHDQPSKLGSNTAGSDYRDTWQPDSVDSRLLAGGGPGGSQHLRKEHSASESDESSREKRAKGKKR